MRRGEDATVRKMGDMTIPLEQRLASAILSLDANGIAACFAPDAAFRALIPPGLLERDGGASTAELIRSWFADSSELQLIEVRAADVSDRRHIFWRFSGIENAERYVVEQHLFCVVEGDRIARADLMCSGFRPEEPKPVGA